jgi:hypothetical protein
MPNSEGGGRDPSPNFGAGVDVYATKSPKSGAAPAETRVLVAEMAARREHHGRAGGVDGLDDLVVAD